MTSRISTEVRREVRDRAGGKCEYCHKPEGFSLYSHHVDHIIAPMHGGTNEMLNLAWACFQCNVAKGSNIASYDDLTLLLTPLFHPRKESWTDHFAWNHALITAKSPIGRVTVRILRLNDEDELIFRERLMRAKRW